MKITLPNNPPAVVITTESIAKKLNALVVNKQFFSAPNNSEIHMGSFANHTYEKLLGLILLFLSTTTEAQNIYFGHCYEEKGVKSIIRIHNAQGMEDFDKFIDSITPLHQVKIEL